MVKSKFPMKRSSYLGPGFDSPSSHLFLLVLRLSILLFRISSFRDIIFYLLHSRFLSLSVSNFAKRYVFRVLGPYQSARPLGTPLNAAEP